MVSGERLSGEWGRRRGEVGAVGKGRSWRGGWGRVLAKNCLRAPFAVEPRGGATLGGGSWGKRGRAYIGGGGARC